MSRTRVATRLPVFSTIGCVLSCQDSWLKLWPFLSPRWASIRTKISKYLCLSIRPSVCHKTLKNYIDLGPIKLNFENSKTFQCIEYLGNWWLDKIWWKVANGKLDLGSFVSFEKIGEYLFGGVLWHCIHTFLTFLSYISTLDVLHVCLKKLLGNLNICSIPVQIQLKPQTIWPRRNHQNRRKTFVGFDFDEDLESSSSSDLECSYGEKSDFDDDYNFDKSAPPPSYSSDPPYNPFPDNAVWIINHLYIIIICQT